MFLKNISENPIQILNGNLNLPPQTPVEIFDLDLPHIRSSDTLYQHIAIGLILVGTSSVDFRQTPAASIELLFSTSQVIVPAPFASKKGLYFRGTGIEQALQVGNNIIDFAIPYSKVKFNGANIINTNIGDRVSLKVLDSSLGTYTGVPLYMLNQFAFNWALSDRPLEIIIPYDAELLQGMIVRAEYFSTTEKTVGVNFNIHEVKQ